MEQNTPYSPLMRAPLNLHGVFGLSWQLYKRGFKPMFFLTLLLVGVFMLVLILALGNMLSQTGALADIQNDIMPGMGKSVSVNDKDAAASALAFIGIAWVLGLVCAFLVMPAYTGAIFMELDQRMEGRCGTFRQLYRYALPFGLKRFYTTFLSLFVVQVIAGIVMNFVRSVIMPIIAILSASAALDFYKEPNIPVLVGLMLLFYLLFGVIIRSFIGLTYPVAAHEGKRAFDAVGRGIKLALKRFGRQFGAMALYMLISIAVLAILLLPLALLWQNTIAVIIVLCLGISLWVALIAPYFPALCTALYVDAAARMPDLPPEIPVIPPAPAMPPQV